MHFTSGSGSLFSLFLFALSFNIVAEAPDSIICEVRIREAGGPGVVVGRRAHGI